MKHLLCAIGLLLVTAQVRSQALYLKTFGKPSAKPLIFLHGGPGYNSASFEGTTAKKLAEAGFYVVVYDRRGEGRSIDRKAAYTFAQTFADLDSIYAALALKKAALVGHSFGGVVATLYAQRNTEKVSSVILVGAPVALQETFRTILRTSKGIYQQRGDAANLEYIAMLEKMDTATIQYMSYTFAHAVQNGFYTAKNLSGEGKAAYALLEADSVLKGQAAAMTYPAPQGFLNNERYTSVDLAPALQSLVASGATVYGLYGMEDGLYSPGQIRDLEGLIGNKNVVYLKDCSHSVFIDQQTAFIAALRKWID